MPENSGRSGGPDRDRTGDLFIAKDAASKNINDLRRCSNGPNRPKSGGESTNRAQCAICAKLGRLIARFYAWWRHDDSEERHCWKCKKRTRHARSRGCLECWWADQQL